MRYIGVDVGTKRTGIAVSDETATLARPLAVVHTKDAPDTVLRLARNHTATRIVVGAGTDLTETPMPRIGKRVTEIADILKKEGLFVTLQSEVYSSYEAGRLIKRNDAAAAAIILQRFLETLRKNEKITYSA